MRSALLLAALFLLLRQMALEPAQKKKERPPELVASTEPRAPADQKKAFKLPPGFDIELVAAEPDIQKPMNLAFDDRGRLWVTCTVEYPHPAKGHKPRDSVRILDDFGPDGQARKITTFADGLNIPIGLLPVKDGALVYTIPHIVKLTDTRGTGKADKREVLLERFGYRDTHGMTSGFTWGLDGWVYACHGYANDSRVRARDGSTIEMNSGNTYRFKADGSTIQQFTWGQVNPFGLCFDPLGNLYSADCHSQPVYQLLRGAYYPSFQKGHDGLGFAPTMMTRYDGSTAIAGVVHYAADHFPEAFHGSFFVGDVVTCRINRFIVEKRGTSPRVVRQVPFLRSEDPWFRPVDIKLGPDGALYVADFYNCIIGHYEVPLDHPRRDRTRGRIWRIVYRGDGKSAKSPRQDWNTASVAELVKDLDHPNLTVRTFATNQLVDRGGAEGIKAVRAGIAARDSTATRRAHGLWVLARTKALDAPTLTAGCKDSDPLVRVHAQRILAEKARLDGEERKLALAGLRDTDPHVQRAAAEVLARHPAPENVPPLLTLRQTLDPRDDHLLHVVRMSLREQFRQEETWTAFEKGTWPEKDIEAVADIALGVPSERSAAFLLKRMLATPDHGQTLARLEHVIRHADAGCLSSVVNLARTLQSDTLGGQIRVFRTIESALAQRGRGLDPGTRAWGVELSAKLMRSDRPGEVLEGIRLAGSLRVPTAQDALVKLASTPSAGEEHRRAALESLLNLDASKHLALAGRILSGASEPRSLREHVAGLLGRVNRADARDLLVEALRTAPAPLQTAIAAALASNRPGAEKLLEAVESGKASARLLQERLVEARLQGANVPNLKTRLDRLTRNLPPADQKIQALLASRRAGYLRARPDPTLGRKAFEKHCAACHQIAGQGAKIGPQLDGIGARGLDRLLEDILDPNRNIDQAFRQTNLTLTNGLLVQGLVLREEGEILILADSQGKEVKVPKKNIAERVISPVSPMPANLDQLPEEELYHLMAYLLAQTPRK